MLYIIFQKPTDLKKAVLSRNISRQNLSSIPTFLDLHSRSNDTDTLKMLNIKHVDIEDQKSPTHISEFVTDIYRYYLYTFPQKFWILKSI